MALLTTQTVSASAGLVPAYGAANASDTFVPDDRTYIHVFNTNAATRTITITTPGTIAGQAIADPAPTIAATTGQLIMGPFPANIYADPTTGLATVTPSATAGVTYAIIRLPVTP